MKNEILPAVAAIVFNDCGEVLLQRRKDRNKWCVISGHVEFGESVEQAILREIREETGIAASITRLIGIYSSPEDQTYDYGDRKVHYVTTYFEAQLVEVINPDLSNDETQELRFFPVTDIPADMDLINPYWLSDPLHKNFPPFIR